jgi:Asp-tRNA(Asn)/Glu-tRNA(Gln) amidotransferase C subunit
LEIIHSHIKKIADFNLEDFNDKKEAEIILAQMEKISKIVEDIIEVLTVRTENTERHGHIREKI